MKKILFCCVVLCLTLVGNAQDMKNVFIHIPDSLAPLFTKVNREDFADFLASNMKAEVKNKFDGNSEMKILTKDYLLIRTTPQNTLQMKLLPVNDSVKVICMINTACGPVCDSNIRFYSMDWKKELSVADFIVFPEVDDFIQVSDSTETAFNNLKGALDITFLKADLSPDNNDLSFTYTSPEYLSDEQLKELKRYVSTVPVLFDWKGGRFIKR